MDRIPAPAEQAGLRPVAVERNAEREDLAAADQRGRPHDVGRRHMIERPDLVVGAPAAPVLELVGGFADRLFSYLEIHRPGPLGFLARLHRPGRPRGAAPIVTRPTSPVHPANRAVAGRLA